MTRRFLLSAVLGAVALAGLFLSVLLRKDATLENSLVDMSILPPVPRSALVVASGTRLQGALESRTLTLAKSPYILFGVVHIPKGNTVRIEPGVAVYAAEGASLIVEGVLAAERVSFVSNHQHPLARLWHGIRVQNGGTAELQNVSVADASAAVTCADRGSLRVREGTLQGNAAGIVTLPGSHSCSIDAVRITNGRVGFHLVGGAPIITNAGTDRVRDSLRTFHEATPLIRGLTVRRPARSAITYAARPDLVVHDLRLPKTPTADELIFDGSDASTHRWRGQDFPTGRVIVRER